MKSKLFIFAGIMLFIIGCGISLYYAENYEAFYYSKIDNTKVEKLLSSDDMNYEYNLECYSKNGKKKNLKFKTTKILKKDAYILLEVRTFGVHKWQEVQYNELPQKVKEKLK